MLTGSELLEALRARGYIGGISMPVPGKWTLFYDWSCDGSYSTATMDLNANGTWTSSEGYNGPWVQIAGMLTFTFNGSDTTYSGNLASKSITGISTTFSGLNGCFYMLQAGVLTTFTEARAKDKADSRGK
jgi:hypothetical protein